MNKNLEKAINDIAKVKGIIYAMEYAFGGIRFSPESLEEASNCISTFYALKDFVEKVQEDIEILEAEADE